MRMDRRDRGLSFEPSIASGRAAWSIAEKTILLLFVHVPADSTELSSIDFFKLSNSGMV